MRAVSHGGRFNESARSNQQDLIGQVEADRQQKVSRVRGMLPRADDHAAKVAIRQGERECRQGPNERAASGAALSNERASDILAALCPITRMVA